MPKIVGWTANIKVESIEKSLSFYRDILGFTVQMVLPKDKPIWALLSYNDITLMLQERKSLEKEYPHLQTPIGGSFLFFVKIDNLDAFYKKIESKVKIIKTPHETSYHMREFAIEDCNGYLLVFAEDL